MKKLVVSYAPEEHFREARRQAEAAGVVHVRRLGERRWSSGVEIPIRGGQAGSSLSSPTDTRQGSPKPKRNSIFGLSGVISYADQSSLNATPVRVGRSTEQDVGPPPKYCSVVMGGRYDKYGNKVHPGKIVNGYREMETKQVIGGAGQVPLSGGISCSLKVVEDEKSNIQPEGSDTISKVTKRHRRVSTYKTEKRGGGRAKGKKNAAVEEEEEDEHFRCLTADDVPDMVIQSKRNLPPQRLLSAKGMRPTRSAHGVPSSETSTYSNAAIGQDTCSRPVATLNKVKLAKGFMEEGSISAQELVRSRIRATGGLVPSAKNARVSSARARLLKEKHKQGKLLQK